MFQSLFLVNVIDYLDSICYYFDSATLIVFFLNIRITQPIDKNQVFILRSHSLMISRVLRSRAAAGIQWAYGSHGNREEF